MWSLSVCDTRKQPKFEIEMVNYNGWDNSYKLSNEDIKVVVVPAIGRIMYFGFKDGENILWNNPEIFGNSLPGGKPMTKNGEIVWANFGGDKVWPIQENEWENINGYRWPPDHWFDGNAQKADIIEKGIKITSPVSEYCGARCIREIILAETGAEVTINQTIEKVKQADRRSIEPINYTIWNVTQIRPPLMALFNLNPNSRHPERCIMIKPHTIDNFSINGDIGVLIPDKHREQKAGADSDHWLAAIVEDVVFGEFFRLQPHKSYPDNGISAEVYTEPDYTELELLSPLNALGVAESMYFSIIWRLHKLPADIKTDEEKQTTAVGWLNTFAE
jgi:hypothetical protein